MPAIDVCEPQVIRAFEKAGWKIIRRPFDIRLRPRQRLYADLAFGNADQVMIVIEVKCFPSTRSSIDELYHAIGQYLIYRNAIEEERTDLPIYLVVPLHIYHDLLSIPVVQKTIGSAKIKVVVVDLESEEIVSWLN